MPLPQARVGSELLVRQRPLPFSYFPVEPGQGGARVGDPLFATSPWGVMEAAIRERLQQNAPRAEALAFLRQAQDFYESAAGRMAANPLLYYYAFLNVGKALLLCLGTPSPLAKARHGISEQYVGMGADPRNSKVVVMNVGGGNLNVYTELSSRLGFETPAPGTTYKVVDLLSQVPIGHRLWREATRRAERFVGVESVEVVQDSAAKVVWLRLYFSRAALSRYGITHKRLREESGLDPDYHEVVSPRDPSRLLCLEQTNTVAYANRPTDALDTVVRPLKQILFRVVTTEPESAYRKYYVYLAPGGGVPAAPQISALWLLFYYLGSVVRYRPHLFAAIAEGRYGAFIAEFIAAQPNQLLYLLASEMRKREVARPAII